ncbi:MAG: hypothetical protein WC718_18490 [Phycisphaerales bacterium]|jgi:hypothetical protein
MIHTDYCNSTDVTARNLAAQTAADAARDTWNRDFAAGRRHYWRGDSLSACANNGERAGFWDAADLDPAPAVGCDAQTAAFLVADALEQRIARDEYSAVRESQMGAW